MGRSRLVVAGEGGRREGRSGPAGMRSAKTANGIPAWRNITTGPICSSRPHEPVPNTTKAQVKKSVFLAQNASVRRASLKKKLKAGTVYFKVKRGLRCVFVQC